MVQKPGELHFDIQTKNTSETDIMLGYPINRLGSFAFTYIPFLFEHYGHLVGYSRFLKYRASAGSPLSKETMDENQMGIWCDNLKALYEQRGWLNPLEYYQEAILELQELPSVKFVPMKELADRSGAYSKIGLRHDIDAGIWSAHLMAEFLSNNEIPGTFFILHTAAYYGVFLQKKPGTFIRQPGYKPYLKKLIASGSEIGLHNDALSCFFSHGVDGLEALWTELDWLRSKGAKIEGTVAHNSASVFGAENFEVFRSRSLGNRYRLNYDDKVVPLGIMSEGALKLSYEANHPICIKRTSYKKVQEYLEFKGNDLIRNREWLWMQFIDNPIFRSNYDIDIWLTGKDQWFIATRAPEKELIYPGSWTQIIEYIKQLEGPANICLNIHPDYICD